LVIILISKDKLSKHVSALLEFQNGILVFSKIHLSSVPKRDRFPDNWGWEDRTGFESPERPAHELGFFQNALSPHRLLKSESLVASMQSVRDALQLFPVPAV